MPLLCRGWVLPASRFGPGSLTSFESVGFMTSKLRMRLYRTKRLLRKLCPTVLENALRFGKDTLLLNVLPPQDVDISPLIELSSISLPELFGDDLTDEWEVTAKAVGEVFAHENKAGAIPVGDRRVIWTLIRRFKPLSVLEIGTSIGGSTLHMAMALKAVGREATVFCHPNSEHLFEEGGGTSYQGRSRQCQ